MKKTAFALALLCLAACGNEEPQNTTVKNERPQAAFEVAVDGLTASFRNQSQHATEYLWDFGDGGSSYQESPSHTYKVSGTYNVTLRARSASREEHKTAKAVSVSGGNPTAAFAYKADGLVVAFTNQSVNATGYVWNFGDGKTGTETSPTHTYAKSGTYSVILTARNSAGGTSDSKTEKITIAAKAPTASFTCQTRHPLTVVCTNTSANAVSYSWDFGDGSTSTQKSPEHKYASVGNYNVTLTATNSDGVTATSTQRVEIGAPSKCYFTGITVNSLAAYNLYYRFKWIDGGITSLEVFDAAQGRVLSKGDMPMHIDFPKKYLIDKTETSYLIYVYSSSDPNMYNYTKKTELRYYVSTIKNYVEKYTLANSGYDITIHLEWQ